MKNRIQKIATSCYAKPKECFNIIFHSAAHNQIRINKDGSKQFTSYVQLKNYQRHIRRLVAKILIAAIFLFIGILIGPAFFNPDEMHEVYIPDGKGDILISNASKNQASIIFTTLDSLHQNEALATSAKIIVYKDSAYTDFFKEVRSNGYAVTHIIPVDGLKEGVTYYIKISAATNANLESAKTVSAWGGKEAITVSAAKNTIYSCADTIKELQEQNIALKEAAAKSAAHDINLKEFPAIEIPNSSPTNKTNADLFEISKFQSENYLYRKDKIQTIISWNTNLPATTQLSYRSDENNAEKTELIISDKETLHHVAILTSLQPAKKYYFQAMSTNTQGEKAVSEEYSLQTPSSKSNVADVIVKNFKEFVAQLGLDNI
jgi:hypothetical protein